MNLAATLTTLYVLCGMIAVLWAFSRPAGQIFIQSTLDEHQIPEDLRNKVITVLMILTVLVWPIVLLDMNNRE